MANDNIVPLIDMRAIEFTAQLEEYIREQSVGLSLPAVVGALETVKHLIIAECVNELPE